MTGAGLCCSAGWLFSLACISTAALLSTMALYVVSLLAKQGGGQLDLHTLDFPGCGGGIVQLG